MKLADLFNWLSDYPLLRQGVVIVCLLLAGYLSYVFTRRIILKWIGKLIDRTKTQLDDIIFDSVMSRRLAFIVPILVIYNFSYLTPALTGTIQRISYALIFLVILTAFTSLLSAINTIYEHRNKFKGRPIKGYLQAITIAVYILGSLVMIGILTGQSLWVLLSGIGALTAVLLLVFRDTILAIVASFQITTYDLVQLGDWLEVPNFHADGNVIDIALHTIKIQNFDKTITVIPTHKLIEVSFKNWRGMQESGGRRIKRSISIDIGTIKFLDGPLTERLKKIDLLTDYLERKQAEVAAGNSAANLTGDSPVDGRNLTNVGTFRAYIEAYLRSHKNIHQDLTFLVRQLAPGPTGLPIEIYVFTNDTRWIQYEGIQSDIFDHLFAAIGEFDLKIFQYANIT